VDDVQSGAWPVEPNIVSAPAEEMEKFKKLMAGK
jgi:hypothetical protein